jgi:hypothetical protein
MLNKKLTVFIIGIILTISASIVLLNYYIYEREFESRNTPDQLRSVLSHCSCQEKINLYPGPDQLCTQPFIDWQNSTHYIDNNECKFLEIHDGFIIPVDADHCPNAMITVDGKCMQSVYDIDPLYSIFLIALIPVILIIIFVFKSKKKTLKIK